jgi:hypothetical protein
MKTAQEKLNERTEIIFQLLKEFESKGILFDEAARIIQCRNDFQDTGIRIDYKNKVFYLNMKSQIKSILQ